MVREIRDDARLREAYKRVSGHFQQKPEVLRLVQFDKGELLNDPLRPLEQFLIVAEGGVVIYDLTESGAVRYVSQSGPGTLLGDVEFSGVAGGGFYTEAAERCACLSIPFGANLAKLQDDPLFLRFVMAQLATKLTTSAAIDVTTQTLQEKVMLYLRSVRPDHETPSVNEAMQQLHCSRRQLQRVLRKLTDAGVLQKVSRGRYRLVEKSTS